MFFTSVVMFLLGPPKKKAKASAAATAEEEEEEGLEARVTVLEDAKVVQDLTISGFASQVQPVSKQVSNLLTKKKE